MPGYIGGAVPGRLWTPAPVRGAYPLNRGRVAWWLALPHLFGGGTWYDIVGQSHGAVVGSVAWRPTTRPGGWGQLTFDGSTGGATVGNVPPLNGAFATVSVAAWANIAAWGKWGEFLKFNNSYILRLGQNAAVPSFVPFPGGSPVVLEGSTPLTLGVWSRVVGVYDGANVNIYVNAIRVATTTRTGTIPANSTQTLGLGYGPGASEFFNGSLDDIAVWNRGLSAADVFDDYDQSRRGYPDALHYY